MAALIAFSCLRPTTKRSTTASMCRTFDSSSSTSSEMSTGLPSMMSCRQPFLRTSVKTKSSSSPYTLNTGARNSISVLRAATDCFQDLACRSAGCRLAGARAVGLTDSREEQVQIAGDIGHGSDGRAGLLPIVFCSMEITGDRP